MAPIVVIGGGVAGLSVASALSRRGRNVVLLEREPRLAQHSSRLSAGMFRLAVEEPVNVRLAVRSRELGEQIAPGFLLATGGLYLCADSRTRHAILDAAGHAGVRDASAGGRPAWLANRLAPALVSPADGIIDVDVLLTGLADDARRHGAELQCGRAVDRLDVAGGCVTGVMVNGEQLSAEVVVDCTGAWSPQLGGAPSTGAIQPRRRHLFILDGGQPVDRIVWDLSTGVYVRPHPEGILACACDESSIESGSPVPLDSGAVAGLRDKLSRWAPALAGQPIRRLWAGVRPMTNDHRFLVGPDPELPGLFRLGGFGGHGMTAGLAAGELAARIICGEHPTDAAELSPARFARSKAAAS